MKASSVSLPGFGQSYRIEAIFVVTLLTLCFTIQTVNCLHCWICNSELDPKCADPFDNTTDYLFPCPDKVIKGVRMQSNLCRKIRQKVEGNWRTIRGCAYYGESGEGTGNENVCLNIEGTYDVYSEYCTCDSKGGCNTGQSVVVNNAINVIIGITFVLFLTQLLTIARHT